MSRKLAAFLLTTAVLVVLLAIGLFGHRVAHLNAKEKVPPVSPDDVTLRLYQLLDNSYGGKLADFCLIADVFKDPKAPDQERQHILRVDYDKARVFGKLQLHVRTVDKITAEQLKAYTPKQMYDYAEVDTEKFTKTEPGLFGRQGDVYLRATEGGPLATAPVTDETRTQYESFLAQYVLPALGKK